MWLIRSARSASGPGAAVSRPLLARATLADCASSSRPAATPAGGATSVATAAASRRPRPTGRGRARASPRGPRPCARWWRSTQAVEPLAARASSARRRRASRGGRRISGSCCAAGVDPALACQSSSDRIESRGALGLRSIALPGPRSGDHARRRRSGRRAPSGCRSRRGRGPTRRSRAARRRPRRRRRRARARPPRARARRSPASGLTTPVAASAWTTLTTSNRSRASARCDLGRRRARGRSRPARCCDLGARRRASQSPMHLAVGAGDEVERAHAGAAERRARPPRARGSPRPAAAGRRASVSSSAREALARSRRTRRQPRDDRGQVTHGRLRVGGSSRKWQAARRAAADRRPAPGRARAPRTADRSATRGSEARTAQPDGRGARRSVASPRQTRAARPSPGRRRGAASSRARV